MASSKDRQEIGTLAGLPQNYRDASNSKSAWDGKPPPVPISLPTNNMRVTTNPFHKFDSKTNNLIKGANATPVGNRTAAGTMTRYSRSLLDDDKSQRPPKRQKTSDSVSAPPKGSALNGVPVIKPKTKKGRHSAPPPPDDGEVITIEDDEDEAPSDDLNLHSGDHVSSTRTSKYYKLPESKVPTEDGPTTQRKTQEMLTGSDPIEEFPERRSLLPLNDGYVRSAVTKIDFRAQQSNKGSKLKMKMKPNQNPLPVPQLGMEDPMTQSTAFIVKSSKLKKHSYFIRCCFIDEDYIESTSGNKIRMALSASGKTVFIEGDDKQYAVFPLAESKVEYPNPPQEDPLQDVIMFRAKFGSKPSLIVLRLDLSLEAHLQTNPFIKSIKDMQGHCASMSAHKASSQIWEMAEQNARQLSGETSTSESTKRMKPAANQSRLEQLNEASKNKTHDLGPRAVSSRESSAPINRGKRKADDLSTTEEDPADLVKPKRNTIKKPNAPSNTKQMAGLHEPLRRSTRHKETKDTGQTYEASNSKRSERNNVKDDTLILSYPQGQPGAVNITLGDLNRLEPGEFLNDTLIEFGLKYWLNGLERENPELASQVHVFNSFFFKKFNQKDLQAGYESVRRWTNKIDIFQKKYIIVPINEHLHWYLIVIHEPEHILTQKAPPPTPSARPSTRSTIASDIKQAIEMSNEDTSATSSTAPRTPAAMSEDAERTSEAEVEEGLNDFSSSCNIADQDSRMASPPVDGAPDDDCDDIFGDGGSTAPPPILPSVVTSKSLSKSKEVEEIVPSSQPPTLVLEVVQPPLEQRPSSPDVMIVDVEKPVKPVSTVKSASASKPSSRRSEAHKEEPPSASLAEISPEKFYKPAEKKAPSRKGKEKAAADTEPAPFPMDVDEKESDIEFVDVDAPPQTRIFSFDSLGSRHPAPMRKLAQYLQMEAKDKKGIDDAGLATSVYAPVPCQQNFCDCGIFLLHFAATFISDPKKYIHLITTQKPKSVSNVDRGKQWRQHELTEEKGRTKLKEVIVNLSKEWKQQRGETSEQKPAEPEKKEKEEEDSDDDIEVIDVQGPPKKGKQKASSSPSSTSKRKTGAAARPRG